MLHVLKLLIPVIVPSWRFFDIIAPSPRIEFSLLNQKQDPLSHWQEFRPRSTHVSIGQMIKRLFWNPEWNDTLFLISCAERLADHPTQHSVNEIFKRIRLDITNSDIDIENVHYFQFQLVFTKRVNEKFEEQIMFTSSIEPYDQGGNR
jgi:hypothetical protein